MEEDGVKFLSAGAGVKVTRFLLGKRVGLY